MITVTVLLSRFYMSCDCKPRPLFGYLLQKRSSNSSQSLLRSRKYQNHPIWPSIAQQMMPMLRQRFTIDEEEAKMPGNYSNLVLIILFKWDIKFTVWQMLHVKTRVSTNVVPGKERMVLWFPGHSMLEKSSLLKKIKAVCIVILNSAELCEFFCSNLIFYLIISFAPYPFVGLPVPLGRDTGSPTGRAAARETIYLIALFGYRNT